MTLTAPAVDIYLTYRCNLRCGHCFVGESLTTHDGHFPWPALEMLIRECGDRWSTRQLTFLGGEPTLHPQFADAVRLAQAAGLSTRVITNGQRPLGEFLDTFDDTLLPQIGFSVDGSGATTHDAIRGRGTFARTVSNINRALRLGYQCHFVSSISRKNYHDVLGILRLADHLGVAYVNLHYVSARGFAANDIVLTIDEWQRIGDAIEVELPNLSIVVRLERTFHPEVMETKCAVRDDNSLLFFPDGRVFMCPMFIDVPNAHAFAWSENGLVPNLGLTENTICASDRTNHCPAMRFINGDILREAEKKHLSVGCIFAKEKLEAKLQAGAISHDFPAAL